MVASEDPSEGNTDTSSSSLRLQADESVKVPKFGRAICRSPAAVCV